MAILKMRDIPRLCNEYKTSAEELELEISEALISHFEEKTSEFDAHMWHDDLVDLVVAGISKVASYAKFILEHKLHSTIAQNYAELFYFLQPEELAKVSSLKTPKALILHGAAALFKSETSSTSYVDNVLYSDLSKVQKSIYEHIKASIPKTEVASLRLSISKQNAERYLNTCLDVWNSLPVLDEDSMKKLSTSERDNQVKLHEQIELLSSKLVKTLDDCKEYTSDLMNNMESVVVSMSDAEEKDEKEVSDSDDVTSQYNDSDVVSGEETDVKIVQELTSIETECESYLEKLAHELTLFEKRQEQFDVSKKHALALFAQPLTPESVKTRDFDADLKAAFALEHSVRDLNNLNEKLMQKLFRLDSLSLQADLRQRRKALIAKIFQSTDKVEQMKNSLITCRNDAAELVKDIRTHQKEMEQYVAEYEQAQVEAKERALQEEQARESMERELAQRKKREEALQSVIKAKEDAKNKRLQKRQEAQAALEEAQRAELLENELNLMERSLSQQNDTSNSSVSPLSPLSPQTNNSIPFSEKYGSIHSNNNFPNLVPPRNVRTRSNEDMSFTPAFWNNTALKVRYDTDEERGQYKIVLHTPSLRRDSLDINSNQGKLQISGICTPNQADVAAAVHRLREIHPHAGKNAIAQALLDMGKNRFGQFTEVFKLPPNVDEQNIKAYIQDNDLVISIPKVQERPNPYSRNNHRTPYNNPFGNFFGY